MPENTPPPPQGQPSNLPPDDVLQALIDQRLSPSDASAAWQALAREPERTAELRAQQADRLALRALHAEVLEEPIPTVLQATLERAGERQQRWHGAARWAGMAAAVLLMFGAGWWSRGLQAPNQNLALDRAPGRQFSAQASVAHAVYAPEQKHPVEVDASQQQHLVQWLSKRLGRPLKLPDLQAKGYALVGGRLLPGDTGARAQFMYQDGQGHRLTLYLGALPPSPAQATGTGTGPSQVGAAPLAGFSFSQEGPVPSFYWIEGDFGYALQADLPRQVLLGLALAVYKQL